MALVLAAAAAAAVLLVVIVLGDVFVSLRRHWCRLLYSGIVCDSLCCIQLFSTVMSSLRTTFRTYVADALCVGLHGVHCYCVSYINKLIADNLVRGGKT